MSWFLPSRFNFGYLRTCIEAYREDFGDEYSLEDFVDFVVVQITRAQDQDIKSVSDWYRKRADVLEVEARRGGRT